MDLNDFICLVCGFALGSVLAEVIVAVVKLIA